MARIYTIGHSNRPLDDFLELLCEHEIGVLVDVRRFPGSRRNPHFNGESLAHSLGGAGIQYAHEPDLGGRRDPAPDSPNTAWRNAGFRAYADHLDSDVARAAVDRVANRAAEEPAALMCAEALYWRCHRRLLADALVLRGHHVLHILGPGDARSHELHPAARVRDDARIVYPGIEQLRLFGEPRT